MDTVTDRPKSRMAWARVFPDQLLAHTQGLSDVATAAYLRFWCHYLKLGQPVADNAIVLARVCGITPKRWRSVRQEWIEAGVVERVGGMLRDPFAQAQIAYYRQRSDTNRRNIGKRWSGRVEDAS